ncbi:hypothetical protein AE921_16885 [Xanthomonas arboricola]|uniref:hypothetical protein n=1 Tax=Xanthomonas arboricola TaxID=56448 RepID=UPI00069D40F2|nr:hypothetical protein [Xanthomonas arboricola]KOA97636.1 hypothetical protein AE921_16885 [Xanthomonas arboricola]KOB11163.1 hypothetical protein AE922_02165 [Xanthomonas arboricola]KOB11901.1 hypothetical protein AE923_03040 [Xanthomonas arboricola]KOB14964.1 hypothetical protein AE925_18530 [Xanthomonas arboricola]KOB25534.1 hypothetical protein AE926_03490 [Xanthomonas arboricola]
MERLVAAVFLALVVAAPVVAAGADLSRNDAALIAHIKRTDPVFSRLLGPCTSEQLQRIKGSKFTYRALCGIRPRPEDDCQTYSVVASGTVDNPAWATVRNVRLSLQCSA